MRLRWEAAARYVLPCASRSFPLLPFRKYVDDVRHFPQPRIPWAEKDLQAKETQDRAAPDIRFVRNLLASILAGSADERAGQVPRLDSKFLDGLLQGLLGIGCFNGSEPLASTGKVIDLPVLGGWRCFLFSLRHGSRCNARTGRLPSPGGDLD